RTFTIHRYVTWADSVKKDHKRVTVVVQWPAPDPTAGDPRSQVALSSLYSPGSVAFGPTTTAFGPTTTVAGPTTTVAGPTTTAAPPPCPGDVTPPAATFEIADGLGADFAGYTNSGTLQLVSTATDTCSPLSMEFSNDGTFTGAWATFANPYAWAATAGEGLKNVWARYMDASGNVTGIYFDQVTVDTLDPTPPSGLTGSRCCAAKKADLTWDNVSTDANLVGYRVLRQAGGAGPFTEAGKVTLGTGPKECDPFGAVCTFQDSPISASTGYVYRVVAYDKAGNNSAPTNDLAL
ncbi:MAG: hypothetical protein ACRD0M_05060, partial [Acidimicrobiales bacterium]